MQLAMARFREEHQGAGRREPWTAKVTINPNGDWVVREYRNLTAAFHPAPKPADGSEDEAAWHMLVEVRYWSRVLDAAAWRGPELPSSWDQYAELYDVRQIDGRLLIANTGRPPIVGISAESAGARDAAP